MDTSTPATAPAVGFAIGDRVQIGKSSQVGTVKFLGSTSFAQGEWVGVELDAPAGKNDGSVAGSRYFECEPQHGLFMRPTDRIVKLNEATKPAAKTLVRAQTQQLPRVSSKKSVGGIFVGDPVQKSTGASAGPPHPSLQRAQTAKDPPPHPPPRERERGRTWFAGQGIMTKEEIAPPPEGDPQTLKKSPSEPARGGDPHTLKKSPSEPAGEDGNMVRTPSQTKNKPRKQATISDHVDVQPHGATPPPPTNPTPRTSSAHKVPMKAHFKDSLESQEGAPAAAPTNGTPTKSRESTSRESPFKSRTSSSEVAASRLKQQGGAAAGTGGAVDTEAFTPLSNQSAETTDGPSVIEDPTLFKESERVSLRLDGTVRFYGASQFANGPWLGVELDEPTGTGDGSMQGVTYFNCEANRGLFLQAPRVNPGDQAARTQEELDEARREVQSLEAKVAEYEAAKIQEQLDESRREVESLEEKVAEYEAARFQEQLDEYRRKVDELQAKHVEYEGQLDESRRESEERQAKLAEYEAARLQEQLDEYRHKVEELQAKHAEYEAARTQEQHDQALRKIEELQLKLVEHEAARLQEQLDYSRREVEQLQVKLAEYEAENEALAAQKTGVADKSSTTADLYRDEEVDKGGAHELCITKTWKWPPLLCCVRS